MAQRIWIGGMIKPKMAPGKIGQIGATLKKAPAPTVTSDEVMSAMQSPTYANRAAMMKKISGGGVNIKRPVYNY